MSARIPPYIFCPRCGRKIFLQTPDPDTMTKILEEGYDDAGRGVCKCGVVLILCYQELPKSPTFSIFFDVYQIPEELYEQLKQKT